MRLPVDGKQSPKDCEAIRALQKRLGIRPANGLADIKTYRLLLVDQAKKNPNAKKKCPVRSYRVTCVDLTRQMLWIQKGKKVTFGPVPVRTGRNGKETRRGWQRVYWRHKKHFSAVYDHAPMPYAQFFNRGQALHGTYKDLFESGSGGCVNLRVKDAKRLWKLLHVGSRIYIWGVKPGTRMRAADGAQGYVPSDDELIAEGFRAQGTPERTP